MVILLVPSISVDLNCRLNAAQSGIRYAWIPWCFLQRCRDTRSGLGKAVGRSSSHGACLGSLRFLKVWGKQTKQDAIIYSPHIRYPLNLDSHQLDTGALCMMTSSRLSFLYTSYFPALASSYPHTLSYVSCWICSPLPFPYPPDLWWSYYARPRDLLNLFPHPRHHRRQQHRTRVRQGFRSLATPMDKTRPRTCTRAVLFDWRRAWE